MQLSGVACAHVPAAPAGYSPLHKRVPDVAFHVTCGPNAVDVYAQSAGVDATYTDVVLSVGMLMRSPMTRDRKPVPRVPLAATVVATACVRTNLVAPTHAEPPVGLHACGLPRGVPNRHRGALFGAHCAGVAHHIHMTAPEAVAFAMHAS